MSDEIVKKGFTAEQVELIKRTIAPRDTTDAELKLFLMVAERLGLDPFARQIYLIRRGGVARPEPSIEGFRVVAERTGQYRGQTPGRWCGRDGVWKDVWLEREPPAAARVGVYRDGFSKPLVRIARWENYAAKDREGRVSGLWRTMPDTMLLKCAEAAALRAAFPNHLGGTYTPDEMAQAGGTPPELDLSPSPEPRERPQKAPEPIQARVLPIRPENGATGPSGAPTGESGAVVELFGKKLRERRDADQLAGWLKEVTKEGYAEPLKRVLWGMCKHRCHELGVDPNVVAQKSKVENAQQKQEVTHG